MARSFQQHTFHGAFRPKRVTASRATRFISSAIIFQTCSVQLLIRLSKEIQKPTHKLDQKRTS